MVKSNGIKPHKMLKGKGLTDTNLLLIITIVVFFAMYISAISFIGGPFLKAQSFFNILNQHATLIIISCGLSLVMITGGIDISVGGVIGLVCMSCAVWLEHEGGTVTEAILLALGIGLAFGLVQGFLVAYLEIQPFIVTLAGMFFANGMTTIVYSKKISSITNEKFAELVETRIEVSALGETNSLGKFVAPYINIGVIVAILVVVILFIVLRWTKSGRNFYAVGGNIQSAMMLGINVKRTKFISHLVCSLLAAVGGFVYFMYVGSGSADHGAGMEMDAIASAIIGGTLLTGGVGNVVGTLFGVLSLKTIQNIVSALGFEDAWWKNITTAAMLCLFLVIQSIVLARKKRGLKTE